jgi:hypothetical protein
LNFVDGKSWSWKWQWPSASWFLLPRACVECGDEEQEEKVRKISWVTKLGKVSSSLLCSLGPIFLKLERIGRREVMEGAINRGQALIENDLIFLQSLETLSRLPAPSDSGKPD